MNAEEFIKIFQEVVDLTEEIENLCKIKKIDNIEETFNKRDELFNKLGDLPEDITNEQYKIICDLKDKLTQKNNFILKAIKTRKNDIKMELALLKKEEKVVDAYKVPSFKENSSIFDFKQ